MYINLSLITNRRWHSLQCRVCMAHRSAKTWKCPFLVPWPGCPLHARCGFACSAKPLIRHRSPQSQFSGSTGRQPSNGTLPNTRPCKKRQLRQAECSAKKCTRSSHDLVPNTPGRKRLFPSVEEQAQASLLPHSFHKRRKPSKALVQHDARLQAIRAVQRKMEQPLQPYSITAQSSSPSVPVCLQIHPPDNNFEL